MPPEITPLPGMVRAHKTAYGTNHVGKPQYSEGSWERIDVWVSDTDTGLVDAGKHFRERRAAAGPNDVSDMASKIYAGSGNVKYHPACPACYLGHGHTVDYHNLHTNHGRKAWD